MTFPAFELTRLIAKFNGTDWEDFLADTEDEVYCEYGILGNQVRDRTAGPGTLRCKLKNRGNAAGIDGYYELGHTNCRAGFAPGLQVAIEFTLDGLPVQKWIGTIPVDGIQSPSGPFDEWVEVAVKDWMYEASKHPLKMLPYAENVTIMDGVALVLANMQVQPPGTINYRTPESIFPVFGSTVTEKTFALAELAKMVFSEFSFLYPTRFGLKVEGRLTRNDERNTPNEYPIMRSDLDYSGDENGDYFVDENGDYFIDSDSHTANFEDTDLDIQTSWGKDFYNSVKFKVYPVRVDAVAVNLWQLRAPISVGAAGSAEATVPISGTYTDPTGVAKSVTAKEDEMVNPVANTHFKMYANRDGTGTDLTANLSVVATFGMGDFKYVFTNSGAAGFITMCKAVGKGLYTDQPVEFYIEDAASIALYGEYPLVVDMKLQGDPMVAARFAQITLYQCGTQKKSVDEVLYLANKDYEHLNAFLYLEPGDRVHIKNTKRGINGDFTIQGVKFWLLPGRLVEFAWVLRSVTMDTFHFVKWTPSKAPVAGSGTWDDEIYGWDF